MSKKTTGRDALAYFITKEEPQTTGSIVVGSWYAVKGKAEADSVLPVALEPGDVFLCSAEKALATGDVVIPLTRELIGFVRDKSIDSSKQTFDATVDEDDTADNQTDGIVAMSGTISGYDLVGKSKGDATSILKGRFSRTIYASIGSGEDTIEVEGVSAPIDLIQIDQFARDAKEGDPIEVLTIPCILTSNGKSSTYGSVTSLNIGFTGCAQDADGIKPSRYVGVLHLPA